MANYDSDWVKNYYDTCGMGEWERWDASLVERVKFEVHLHYLRKYLKAGVRLLEIGAGPGRFTQELAQISQKIVVADISPVQLRLNRENAHAKGYAAAVERWVECDICDLKPHFEDQAFDAVVCYGGPLSYVFDQREQAMSELIRVTKPGGFILLSVMSLWGAVHQFLPFIFEVNTAMNRVILATGDLKPEQPPGQRHFCHMYRAAELRRFLERSGVTIEVLSASNCLATTWGDLLKEVQGQAAAWEYLIEMELEACRESGCLDMGTHLIAVCRR